MCACLCFCYTFVCFAFVKVQLCADCVYFVLSRLQNIDICIYSVCDYWIWMYRLWLFVVLFSIWFPICSLREAILQSRVCEGRGRGRIKRDVRLLPRRVFLPPLESSVRSPGERLCCVLTFREEMSNACAHVRASAVFRFLPSPLHLWMVSVWFTVCKGWRQKGIFLHRWSVKTLFFFTCKLWKISRLRVKVKGEGRNCKLQWVRDARGRVRERAPTHARRDDERRRRRGPARLFQKRGEKMEETRAFSRKSPLVFGESLWIREKTDFCCRKISLIRNIVLIFALDKTQLSFFLPPSGVYHSAPRRTSSRCIYANDLWLAEQRAKSHRRSVEWREGHG